MIPVLITGGAGYIGSHTAKRLAVSGYNPIVYDNLSMGHRWAVKWGELIEADLNDKATLRRVIEEHEIQAVIHFAAYAYVGESVAKPRKYFRNNVVNSLNLLECMMDCGVQQLVFSSTCALYGVPNIVPITEAESQKPINPYGESKMMVEHMMKWFGDAYGLKWIALRYFNASGASADGEIGEDHDPETHLIPLVIGAAQGKRENVKVFGTDYPTTDGTAVRDYIHVMDLADAHLRALETLQRGGGSGAFNVGTGVGHSVREIIDSVERVGGKPVPYVETGRRPGDPPVLIADAAAATKALGWSPKYTVIDDIVRSAWRWHEKHG